MVNDTQAVALGILHKGAMTGGQIARETESMKDFFSMTRSQLYRELPLMESAGLVKAAAKGERNAQPYAITAAGRKAFREWAEAEPKVVIRDGRKARDYLGSLVEDAPKKTTTARKRTAKKAAPAPDTEEAPAPKKATKRAPAKKATRRRKPASE